MGKITVDELKKLHSNETPQHVKDFNKSGGVEKYGGKHFDDPTFSSEPVERQSNKPDFKKGASDRPATEKMVKFLHDLVAERAPNTDPEFVQSVVDQGFGRVREAIGNLKAMPKVDNTIQTPELTTRLNRYKGQCEECGGHVAAQEGRLTKSDSGQWEIVHLECPPSEFPFPYGRYAVDTEEGHLGFYIYDHRGLWVQASDEKHRLPTNAIKSVAEKIAVDPQAATERYGQELGNCGRCGRTLTDEESRQRGTGPVCATKGW